MTTITIERPKLVVRFGDITSPQFCSRLYDNRWRNILRGDLLPNVDEGVEAMVQYASLASETTSRRARAEALADLECAALATAREVRKVLALYSERPSPLPRSTGQMLAEAVSQYFPCMSSAACNAIVAGIRQAEQCAVGLVSTDELSDRERGYRTWAATKLAFHLIPYLQEYENYDEPDAAA